MARLMRALDLGGHPMSLIHTFKEPKDILRKVAYEGNLLLWTEDFQCLAYALFNFSVTAHALRDWCLKHLGIKDSPQEESFHNRWNQVGALVVVREIANSSKHFGLRKASTVSSVNTSTARWVPFRSEKDFEFPPEPVERASYAVIFSDGTSMEIHELVHLTYDAWLSFFQEYGIPHEKPYQVAELFLRPDIFRNRNLEGI
jgi:hypothetical protein